MLMTGTAMKCGANRTLKEWVGCKFSSSSSTTSESGARDRRSTTESTEIHGKENPNQLPLSVSFPGATPARRVGSFRGYPFVMIFLAGVMRSRPSAFRFHWLDGLAVRKRGGPGPHRDTAAVQAKVAQSPRAGTEPRHGPGETPVKMSPCVKKHRRYGEIRELWCFNAREISR